MMPPSTLLSPLLWAEATFGSLRLGDPRRDRRALTIAYAMARETGASLPKQLHDEAALEATYRFLHSGHVSYEDLLRPHVEMTRQDCREQAEVLLIQDTTEVDYQHHPKTSGLGPVGNGAHHGFLLQTVLAVAWCLASRTRNPFCARRLPPKKPSKSVCSGSEKVSSGNEAFRRWEPHQMECAGSMWETATAIS
jgi:Transposase DNA-binding